MKNVTLTIQFAKNGYVVHTSGESEDGNTGTNGVEVFPSTGKLMKALREAISEYTLIPKKADDKADAE